MKILNINNKLYNYNNYGNKSSKVYLNNDLNNDVVSFSHKKYSIDDIKCPTDHCGYCGCKVYSDDQIESIAKEILSSKSGKLQGKIRSVLEKLDGAIRADEIAIAKSMENYDEIQFFKNILEISNKSPNLKGDAIFSQIYDMNEKDAIKVLTKNMRPILRTIDHISPKNRKEENNNTDMNLIEACYCCNHDLKKGVSFNEFYTMFPSIKNNMPDDKFQYANANLLEFSQEGIKHRLSADNIIKSINRLVIQKNEILNRLNSIDYRISELKLQIDDSISSIMERIKVKKGKIAKLEAEIKTISQDEIGEKYKEINALEAEIHLFRQTINDLKKQKAIHNTNY